MQSVRNKCYDDHSAVYHLLEDKLQRHLLKSHMTGAGAVARPHVDGISSGYSNSIPRNLAPQPQPQVSQRRSSITTGVG